ncbi:MAG TPA: hypothetical protein VF544_04290 [Pyrinomonadaceae bacterium]|jgi:hypothetical protein
MSANISRPVEEWPLVLSGPVLRRVTENSVTVFVALKQPRKVALHIYGEAWRPETEDDLLFTSGEVETLPLGANLHVLVVEAATAQAQRLQPGKTYYYDLKLTREADDGDVTVGLAGCARYREGGATLLSGERALGYREGWLPSFALPPGLAGLNIIHGSCRKPHGPGKDLLAFADDLIKASAEVGRPPRPESRPHQLLLTGDQIYADDVAVTLLKALMHTGGDLTAWPEPEVIKLSEAEGWAEFDPRAGAGDTGVDPRLRPGAPRAFSVDKRARYTASEPPDFYTDGHLMMLGEFYAMYLMAFSEALWPRGERPSEYHLPRPEESVVIETLGGRPPDFLEKLAAQRSAALEFASTLWKVRRALANVPTYMIFDDHEVTDDWNLDGAWYENVRRAPLGRQMMRNALLAYAVFQDWGNRPERYVSGSGKKLFDAITGTAERTPALFALETTAGSGLRPKFPDTLAEVERLLGLTLSESVEYPLEPSPAAEPERMRWDYSVSGPEHQIVFLDTRTWRSYPDRNGGAGLISAAALDAQLAPLASDAAKLCIVVSAAPVFGLQRVESPQAVLSKRHYGPYPNDWETWERNPAAFAAIVNRLAALQRVVVLSGDVHYAFSKSIACFGAGEHQRARIVQLCASSLKNRDMTWKTDFLGLTDTEFSAHNRWGAVPRVYAPPEDARRAELSIRLQNYFRQAARRARADRRYAESDELLCAGKEIKRRAVLRQQLDFGWGEGQFFDEARQIVYEHEAQSGDVSWRYVKQTQSASETVGFSLTRGLVSVVVHNNIGRLTFDVPDIVRPHSVEHSLYWYRSTEDPAPRLAKFSVVLTPPTDAER